MCRGPAVWQSFLSSFLVIDRLRVVSVNVHFHSAVTPMMMGDSFLFLSSGGSMESSLHSCCGELKICRRRLKQKSRISLLWSQLVGHVFSMGHRSAGCPFHLSTFLRARRLGVWSWWHYPLFSGRFPGGQEGASLLPFSSVTPSFSSLFRL